MKQLRKLRMITVNAMIILALVMVTLTILDWYNPYMAFMSHALLYRIAFGITILLSIVLEVKIVKEQKRRRRARRSWMQMVNG